MQGASFARANQRPLHDQVLGVLEGAVHLSDSVPSPHWPVALHTTAFSNQPFPPGPPLQSLSYSKQARQVGSSSQLGAPKRWASGW